MPKTQSGRFFCTDSEPKIEWVFVLAILSLICFSFFIFYLLRIIKFYFSNVCTLYSLWKRIFFDIGVLVEALFLAIRSFGTQEDSHFGWFKFWIIYFDDYYLSIAYVLILCSWVESFLYLSNSSFQFKFFKKVAFIFSIFTIILFFVSFFSSIVFFSDESENNGLTLYHTFMIIRDICLYLLLLYVPYFIYQSGIPCGCGLGHPGKYLMTLCFVLSVVFTMSIIYDCVMFSYQDESECSQAMLFLTLLGLSFGKVLPFGFITVVDIISVSPSMDPYSLNESHQM